MANDRLYLVCKACKAGKLLFKYYPLGHGYVYDPEKLEAWMNEHLTFCRGSPMFLDDDTGFDLVTEDQWLIIREAPNAAAGGP